MRKVSPYQSDRMRFPGEMLGCHGVIKSTVDPGQKHQSPIGKMPRKAGMVYPQQQTSFRCLTLQYRCATTPVCG
jgi:hypothetical protein